MTKETCKHCGHCVKHERCKFCGRCRLCGEYVAAEQAPYKATKFPQAVAPPKQR